MLRTPRRSQGMVFALPVDARFASRVRLDCSSLPLSVFADEEVEKRLIF